MSENQAALDSVKGQEQVEALMAKMSPEQQEVFKKSLQEGKPVHVHIEKDGSVKLGDEADAAAPDPEAVRGRTVDAAIMDESQDLEDPIPGASEAPVAIVGGDNKPKKPNKIELKRQQIFQQRMQRHIAKGLTPQKAYEAMQKEDYDALPVEKKFQRLEHMVASALQQFAEELMNLSQGQHAIGDAFDINYRAISKMFEKLGLPVAEHASFMQAAQTEHIEAKKKMIDAQAAAQKKAQEAQKAQSEQSVVEKELVNAESRKSGLEADSGEPSAPPPEATVFGG